MFFSIVFLLSIREPCFRAPLSDTVLSTNFFSPSTDN